MKLEDAELVRQTLAGNKDAFSELVSRYSGLICGLAYHFVGNMADAEDLAQEAFLRAYKNLVQLKNPSKFGQWLRQITANLCRNWKTRYSNDAKGIRLFDPAPGSRDIRRFAQIVSQQPLPDEIVEKKELQEAVRAAIDSLSEKNRLTVILFYMHDLSYQDVSHFLGIPVSAVKARLHKSRKQLKERLLMIMENEFEKIKPPKEEFTKQVMLAIGGRVVSAGDGSPIANAKVILDYQTHTFTDEEGNYQIKVESGQATVRHLWIRARGYPTYFQSLCINPQQTQAVLETVLDAEVEASISGRVVTEDGEPVEGFEFLPWGWEYGACILPDWPVTDANGYFRYDGLCPSRHRYNLYPRKSDYLWRELEFNIDKPGHLDLGEIVLKKGVTISGQVTNAQGEPVADAYVHAGVGPSIGNHRETKAQTDKDGRYILRNVDWKEDGTAYVMVFAKGYGMSSRKVELGESQTLDGVDFQLEEGTKISGRLTDEEGKPIEGRRLYIYALTFQDTTYYLQNLVGKTNAEGRFCIDGLPQEGGEAVLSYLGSPFHRYFNYDASQSTIKVGMRGLHLVELEKPNLQISGTVVDAKTGQPIPKFHIRVGYPKADNLDKRGKIYRGIPPEFDFYNAWGSLDYYNAWGRWNPLRVITYLSFNGKFTIEHLPSEEKICLLITAEGYVATEAGPFLATQKPDASKLTIKMQRGKTIRGVVTDSKSSQPIYGAMVTYFSPTQPYAHEGQILPHCIRIPTEVYDFTLPLGGETICTRKSGEYKIATAQTKNNYLLVTYPGYSPAIIGPISITESVLDLPIALTQKKLPKL